MNENRWKIISDILEPIYEEDDCCIGELKREMKISNRKLKEYINFLSDKQYLNLRNENGKNLISVTEKGRVFFRIVNLRKETKKERGIA